MTDRTIFIGDLHGCANEAKSLLDQLQLTPNDWVIFLGDLIDRGPDNGLCIDLVREREQVQGKPACIMGNHEERHIDYERCIAQKGRLPHQIPPTHVATRAQLTPEHHAWMKALPLFLRVPEHNAVAVHAGVFPGRTVEQQDLRHLLHIQMIRPYNWSGRAVYKDGKPYDKSVWPSRVPPGEEGWRFWTHFWDGPEHVVFGHSVLTEPLLTDKVSGIDGGCCFGLALHALVLPERKIVTVGSTDPSARTGGKRIDTYPIHENVSIYS